MNFKNSDSRSNGSEIPPISAKKLGYGIGIFRKNEPSSIEAILISDCKVMKVSQISPKGKAIALVFALKMTKFEIQGL